MDNTAPQITHTNHTITNPTSPDDPFNAETLPRRRTTILRLLLLGIILLFAIRDGLPDTSRGGRIRAQVADHEFNYIAWELNALWHKAQQAFFGFTPYMTESEEKEAVIAYLILTGEAATLTQQIETLYIDNTDASLLAQQQQQLTDVNTRRQELQPIVEPIIECHVSIILQQEGFGTLGQILPPVSFRFVAPPDVLIVSPRDTIRQDFAISLQGLSVEERARLEQNVEAASPDDAAYITGVGGVGIWPAIVIETRWAAIAYEIVAHEWAHHYLFAFPSGQEYLVRPETRFINETVATVFGNAMALKILEYFYADEVAAGRLWVPDYPALEDFFPGPQQQSLLIDAPGMLRASTASYLTKIGRSTAAQTVLNIYQQATSVNDYIAPLMTPDIRRFEQPPGGIELNRTRITTDYLLSLGRVAAAESLMESREQWLGMRVLNQAWFAFNGGYQAAPSSGAGVAVEQIVRDVTDPAYAGDPIGPAVHEIAQLSPTLEAYLVLLRDVTTRDELIQALITARQRWGS